MDVAKKRMVKADMAEEMSYLSKCQTGRSIQKTQRQRIWLDSHIFKRKLHADSVYVDFTENVG